MIARSLNLVEQFWFYAHFLKHSHLTNFAWFLRWMSVDCVGNCFHMPVSAYTISFVDTDQWASSKTPYGRPVPIQFYAHPSQNQAKFENGSVSRNGHKIKITQPNSMILVSFYSAEDALFNDVKQYDTFSSQSTENQPFRFFLDTRYTLLCKNGPYKLRMDLLLRHYDLYKMIMSLKQVHEKLLCKIHFKGKTTMNFSTFVRILC